MLLYLLCYVARCFGALCLINQRGMWVGGKGLGGRGVEGDGEWPTNALVRIESLECLGHHPVPVTLGSGFDIKPFALSQNAKSPKRTQ